MFHVKECIECKRNICEICFSNGSIRTGIYICIDCKLAKRTPSQVLADNIRVKLTLDYFESIGIYKKQSK
jgi:hypothetical protein